MNTATSPASAQARPAEIRTDRAEDTDAPVRIRRARTGDADTVIDLCSLIDLHRPADEVPAALEAMRPALADNTDDGPLSHQRNHFLFAETTDGTPVGVIACGPAMWIYQHPGIPVFMRGMILRRVATVHNLAVRPNYRGRGIARALLARAEQDFRHAGYAMLTLRHEPNLEGFYRPAGYTSGPRLAMVLPPLGLITQTDRGWRHAIKPLDAGVSFTTVQGTRAVTGILTDRP